MMMMMMMMNSSLIKTPNTTTPTSLPHHKSESPLFIPQGPRRNITPTTLARLKSHGPASAQNESEMGRRKLMLRGAASVGIVVLMMMGVGHDDKAWALGPEGPLMEEFWENVRRYGLYALTVSTGVLYSVFQPIYELLRNPISAILVLLIIGGTFYIGSQVLSAMVGLSDFDYQYAY